MIKKSAVIFMALILSVCCVTACSDSSPQNSSSASVVTSSSDSGKSSSDSSSADNSVSPDNTVSGDMFADGDFKDVTAETVDAAITLSGNSGTISDTTRGSSGSKVTITSKGIYRVSGTSENVSIIINDNNKSGNIYLILDNVSMTNSSDACIYVESCDKLIVQCVGENTLTYNNSDENAEIDGAIYSKDDVTVNGSGILSINSQLHGIVCKDDLKITGAELNINSSAIGIKAGDSLRIGGGKTAITSGHDGIKLSNKNNDSCFYFENADLTINTDYDGISVTADSDGDEFNGNITLSGGTINITTGGGADHSKNSDTSQKGIKCAGNINISDTSITVSSADDAIHGKSDITVNSGILKISTSDDGITASDNLIINGGNIDITKSYEGLEAGIIEINDGTISVVSSDDGINTAGGSDTDSDDDNPWDSSSNNAKLTINGGNVYVNSSGDGLDSNGSIFVTGGIVIIEGSTADNNGALDKGDSSDCVASITGGTVLALGSSGMAVNFDTGTQCSALVTISGTNGTEISVDDGSGFKYTATKDFTCAVYSSPSMTQGNSYTLTAGSETAAMDFSSGLYYTDVSGGRNGGFGGGPGGFGR
ncbi:MAG: carbohydrate-binding domain-containing protein [Clostridia bacterium]|nr:carbohydrate-binding domain-containing protein [Clostridia bacterium]